MTPFVDRSILIRQQALEKASTSDYFRRPNPEMDKGEARLRVMRDRIDPSIPTIEVWKAFFDRFVAHPKVQKEVEVA